MSNAPTTADSPPVRFSLRTMLVVVTIVCVLLAPYHWLGFSYLFSLVLSIALVASSVRSYVRKWQTTPIMLSAIGAFSSFCIGIGSIVILFHSICNLIGSIYADFAKPKPRNFALILVCLAFVPYAVMIGFGAREFYRIGELRIQYPVASLAGRLQFEDGSNRGGDSAISQLDSDVEQRLLKFEQQVDLQSAYRGIAFSQLHNDTYRRFAAAEGFGPARMVMIPKKGRFSHYLDYSRNPAALPLSLKSRANTSASVITDSVHIEVLEDFFAPDSFGEVTDSNHVTGFEPHGPNRLNVAIGVIDDDDTAYWQLTRFELVSLLRHDDPRVYVAETIPLMNELENLPHRPLNEFEAAALPQLETQRDTVIEETTDGAVMLGAVRAGNDCLQCHNGPRGKLLGAFSYEFRELK